MASPTSNSKASAADFLADEAARWHANMLAQQNYIPVTFTGLKSSGLQFSLVLDSIPWTREAHIQKAAFLNWLCQKEDVSAYAYGSLMVREDEQCFLRIVAQDGLVEIETMVPVHFLDDGSRTFDKPEIYRAPPAERIEWTPYGGLLQPDAIPSDWKAKDDEAFFKELWGVGREQALWVQRRLEN